MTIFDQYPEAPTPSVVALNQRVVEVRAAGAAIPLLAGVRYRHGG